MTTKEQVIIIGGGAAGLLAAKELCDGYAVTLLEARPVLGGRMLAGGAEFVHGRLPLTLGLLSEAGLNYTTVTGRFIQVHNGVWQEEETMIDGWEGLLTQMRAVTTDTTMTSFLDSYYPGPQHASFREEVKSYVQGFDLADPSLVSVQALYREWSHEGEDNFRIDGGYAALITFLEKVCSTSGVKLLTSQTVTSVAWSPGAVSVQTADGSVFKAAKLLVTVPLSLLQAGDIQFSPALPKYETAAQQIGFGTVIKVVLTFQEAFWRERQADIGFIFSGENVPTWWTQAPDEKPVLTGWLGGPPAQSYSHHTDEVLLQIALVSLSSIFNVAVADLAQRLTSGAVFNWVNDPFTRGAYSYDFPGSTDARALLNTPISGTLFFAGEALYDGASPGTVEAALTSGKVVADRIEASR